MYLKFCPSQEWRAQEKDGLCNKKMHLLKNCTVLITCFYFIYLAPSGNKSKRTTDAEQDTIPVSGSTGFDRGLEAEKILGASDNNGRLTFLIQFKGVDQAEMVPSSVANEKIPRMVIHFYEERLSWYSDNED